LGFPISPPTSALFFAEAARSIFRFGIAELAMWEERHFLAAGAFFGLYGPQAPVGRGNILWGRLDFFWILCNHI
jgi:hypothetical protein